VTVRSAFGWIGAAVGLVALAFVLARLIQQLPHIPAIDWTYLAAGSLAGAVLLSTVPTIVAAAAMPLLLDVAGVSLSQRGSFALVGRSQIGKYLPGNVFHYLGRVALGVRSGLPAAPLALAVTVETGLTVVVALTVGIVGSLREGAMAPVLSDSFRRSIFTGAAVLAAIGLLPLVVPRLRRGVRGFVAARRSYYASRQTLVAAVLYSLSFVALGVAIELLLRGVLGVDSQWGWVQFAWRFALVWVVGLLAIGAPAGLGVREALLLVWFSPVLGESVAVGLAALLRLVTIVADIVVFALTWLLSRSRPNEVSTAPG